MIAAMWQCPVCEKENETMQCPVCGFDVSQDYESYPSLSRVAPAVATVAQRRKLLKEKQETIAQDEPKKLPPQPDRYFYNIWYQYHVTEQEARTGGKIAVYKGVRGKEYHSLPPYSDIKRWDNERCGGRVSILHGGGVDTEKLTEYSDGCLQQAYHTGFLSELDFGGCLFVLVIPIIFIVFIEIILQLVPQIADWIAEAFFDYDLEERYSINQFGLMLHFFPFAFYGGQFRTVPMDDFWDWLPYGLMPLIFVYGMYREYKDFSLKRKAIQKEIERRRKL